MAEPGTVDSIFPIEEEIQIRRIVAREAAVSHAQAQDAQLRPVESIDEALRALSRRLEERAKELDPDGEPGANQYRIALERWEDYFGHDRDGNGGMEGRTVRRNMRDAQVAHAAAVAVAFGLADRGLRARGFASVGSGCSGWTCKTYRALWTYFSTFTLGTNRTLHAGSASNTTNTSGSLDTLITLRSRWTLRTTWTRCTRLTRCSGEATFTTRAGSAKTYWRLVLLLLNDLVSLRDYGLLTQFRIRVFLLNAIFQLIPRKIERSGQFIDRFGGHNY